MATKTRGSLIATLIVVGIVAAAASYGEGWNLRPAPVRNDTEEHIEVVVRFTPSPNHRGIHIKMHVDGHEVIDYLAGESPWKHAQWVPKGAEIAVMAQQSTPDMVMCTMTSNGFVVDTSARKGELGSVRCWHNRRTKP